MKMPTTFHIPGPLLPHTAGRARVSVPDGGTVAEALAALFAAHPGLRDRVLDEQGRVRRHVNVFVGGESIRFTGGLSTPLPPGAEVSIIPAVSGGTLAGSPPEGNERQRR